MERKKKKLADAKTEIVEGVQAVLSKALSKLDSPGRLLGSPLAASRQGGG